MRAVVLSEFGAPSVLRLVEDWPDPKPGPGQVRVDVAYANITFVETQIRAGLPPSPAMAPTLPAVLGNGVGGVVGAVGAGVDPTLRGIRVVAGLAGRGGYAQRCVVPADRLIRVPDALGIDAAVALLADGRTALALMDTADVRPGETVLVEAAAGGVGSLLVQLATHAGARVVALAGGPRKVGVARELGADIGVDYLEPDWPAVVKAQVGTVHVVFDGVGGQIGRDAFTLLADSGRYAGFGVASGSFAAIPATDRPGITRLAFGPITPQRSIQLTRQVLDHAVDGTLHPVIGQRFRLDRAADAHTAIETRSTIGKTLLVVDDPAVHDADPAGHRR